MNKKILGLMAFSLAALASCGSEPVDSNSSQAGHSSGTSLSDGDSKLVINNPSKDKLAVGETLQLSVQADPDIDVSLLKWVSSDPSVAFVDDEGLVKAASKGTALITVSSDEFISQPISINVDVTPVTSLIVQNEPSLIGVGETIRLETSVLPSEVNQGVEITSSSQAIEVNSSEKTLKAIKHTDEEVTIKVFASKDFSKHEEFKVKVKPLNETEKIRISFETGSYAPKESLEVTKGSILESISYDPFSNIEDKNSVSDVVFFGFYFDEKFVTPVTFPLTSTYSDLTLYAKFVDLKASGNGYDWNYEDNGDGSVKVSSLNTYSSTSVLTNLSVGIPAYHEGKEVTSFKKITTNDFVNSITSFALPNTIKTLPANGIQYWKNLEYLYIPSDTPLASIPEYGISSLSKLKSLFLPDTITEISKYALNGNKSLANIHLPRSLETVGEYAFGQCESLKELDFKSVKTIDQFAFCDMAKLKYVNLPENLEKLSGVFPFQKSTENIIRFTVSPNNKFYSSDDFGSLYNKDKTMLIVYANGKGGTNAYIPNTVQTIYDQAFGYSELEVTKIPSSVTTLEYAPFYNMPNLKAVFVPKSVVKIKYNAFSLCDFEKLVVYTEWDENQLPSDWSSTWNYNSNNDQMEKTKFNTIYGFDSSRFVF